MKTKVLIAVIATLLLASCQKKYFADRPPKQWNYDYVDPTYLWEHRNSLAYGDTVMVWGWLGDTVIRDCKIPLYTDSSYTWRGTIDDLYMVANIWTSICEFRHSDLEIEIPNKPCKVYVTGRFNHIARECHCDRWYNIVPEKEEDVIFIPIN